MDLVATNSKAANPGKLKDERKWPEGEKALINYLAVIPSVCGIPLSYVVREAKDPKAQADYGSFNERNGQYYIADARRVHTLLLGFLQGEQTENMDSFHLSLSGLLSGHGRVEAALRWRRKFHTQDCRRQEDSIVTPLQERACASF
jgi:hypothetical protein